MFNKDTNYLLSPPIHTAHHRTSEILLHQHEMLYGNYLAANANSVLEPSSSFLINQDPSPVLNTCPKKQTGKKDRHSKIQTAQGPRDRRVRLSIGIARKFFDLQEMLGFDKPSKTLDWLLTKSKTAIKDLVLTKQNSQDDKDLETGKNLKTKSANKVKEAPDLQSNLAKESRVKARARARERTREKMCIKQINENRNTTGYDLNPSNVVPIQYMNNQLEVCKISGCQPSYEAASQEGLIQESIVIKRKVTKNPSIFGFQQNPSPYTAPENWDISSFTQSNMFVNRSSNN